MDNVHAGQLRHQVTLQSYTVTSTDDRGQPVGSWEDEAILRASIDPVRPEDVEAVNQLYHNATEICWVRYHPEVRRDRRLLFGDRVLYIGHVSNIGERNNILKLLCSEVV